MVRKRNAASRQETTDNSSQPPPTRAASPAAGPDIAGLSGLFTAEPELLLAMLEAADGACPEEMQLLLSAAAEAALSRPRYADLHYYAAWVAYEAQDWASAEQWLQQALRINPGYRDALILAARVQQANQQPSRAVAYLEEALDRGADYPDVHLMLGDLYRADQRPGDACRAYQRALELNPSLTPASERMAACADETRAQRAS